MRRTVAVGLVLVCAVAGCGVGAEPAPRAIPLPATRPTTAASATPEVSPLRPSVEKLCLIKDGTLVAVARRVAQRPSAQTLLADLLAGPTKQESDAGFTSALGGTALVLGVQVTAGTAMVALAPAVEDTARADAIPAFGQIVCTLTTHPEIGGVTFTRDGQPIKVPRADALLTEGPLTTKDYADIIAPGG